jgi:starch phosphorylase
LAGQLAASGAPSEAVEAAKHLLDPDRLTIGFARRFATYKRPDLLLQNRERLLRLLTNPERPVQLILAGKAHPADQAGQALIQDWIRFIRESEARRHAIFISDYDMRLAQDLVQGVDVWINTPRRPWEASGTSGMKVLVNGGLNLSELDGWWAEAYSPELGWALGDGLEHGDDPAWDAFEANKLYDLLEREVIPEFYTRDAGGTPAAWLKRIRESLAQLTPRFSANRAVREYTERYYIPAAAKYRQRLADNGKAGRQVDEWRHAIDQKWDSMRFEEIHVDSDARRHAFEVQIFLAGLNPDAVRVELYADSHDGAEPVRKEMQWVQTSQGASAPSVYRTTLSSTRPASDYTARVIPQHSAVAVPLECTRILWQR